MNQANGTPAPGDPGPRDRDDDQPPAARRATRPFELLRPGDQRSIAALATACLLLLAAMWRRGQDRGGLVEIDRAAPLTARFQVDVNRADWPELTQLPGVGQILAERLIAERERSGPFRSVDDLERVPGVGPQTLQRLRPYLLPLPEDASVAAQ